MNIRNELQDTNVKAAIISGMLFFILAFPDLFQAVDTLLKMIVGGRFANMHLVVLLIHSVLFAVMFYYVNRFLQKRVLIEGLDSNAYENCVKQNCPGGPDDYGSGEAYKSCLIHNCLLKEHDAYDIYR